MLCISDSSTNDWINSQYNASTWIGYSDLSDIQQGNYQWVTGCSSTYTNWSPHEPSNINMKGGFVRKDDDSNRWSIATTNLELPCACEKSYLNASTFLPSSFFSSLLSPFSPSP